MFYLCHNLRRYVTQMKLKRTLPYLSVLFYVLFSTSAYQVFLIAKKLKGK